MTFSLVRLFRGLRPCCSLLSILVLLYSAAALADDKNMNTASAGFSMQNEETAILSFSIPEQSKDAILTSGVFDLALTQENTESFLSFVNFSNATHYHKRIYLDAAINQADVPNIEVRFGIGTQKAHRFTVPAGTGSGVPPTDYTYQDYVDVPFQVWDIDNDRQLMASFRDQQNDGSFNLVEFNNTAGDEINHSREYLFIHNIDYSDTPDINVATVSGHLIERIYFLWPYLPSGGTFDSANLPASTLFIDVANARVDAEVPFGTDLTGLVPAIEIGLNSTISPASGQANDFTWDKIYKVTAPDGITFEKWLVHVKTGPNPATKLDSLVLIDFYNNTDGANWIDPWNLSMPMEQWMGVTLTDGRVTRLDLAGRNITGTIPSRLGELSELRWLDLERNKLEGTIPVELGNLSDLRSLLISDNKLTGSIPVEIGQLTNLVNLWLQVNQLTGELPAELGNLPNLLFLNASGNKLSGNIPGSLANTGLIFLFLSDNQLIGSIPAELSSLSSLKGLRLDYNSLSGVIPAELGSLSKLETLIIDNNPYLAGLIPETLTGLTLSTFVFSNTNLCEPNTINYDTWKSGITNYISNNLQCDPTKADFISFKLPQQVKSTNIDDVNHAVACSVLSGTDLTSLVADFIVSPGASVLINTTQQFSGATVNDFSSPITYSITSADGLTTNEWTVEVQFADANIEGDSLALVNIYHSTNGLNWNNTWDLSAPMNTWYGVEVAESRVVSLDLNNNNLVGPLPSDIGVITRLNYLDLYGNGITGEIPSEIGNLTELTLLGLWKNKFTGSIPSSLGQLTKLKTLDIGLNDLTGEIPEEIWNLTLLEYLGIYATHNSGEIPASIGNLVNLTWLQLIGTHISGPIPAEIGNLTKLEKLDLWNNNLTGTIPETIGNLTLLNRLNLYGNQLSGSLPSTIGNLSNVESIKLNSNQLNGSLPIEIGHLAKLQRLWIQNNSFEGSLPEELGLLENLYYLNAPNNNFSGSIPASLGNTKLQFLYLGNNNLTGTIPAELGNLEFLEDLRMESNDLSGVLPVELAGLSMLNGLTINDNLNLSGSIQSEFTNLTLEAFVFQNTGLCEPLNSLYQSWAATISNYQASGVTCDLSAADIESFSLAQQTGPAIIGDGTIALEVEYGTDLSALIANFTLSSGAKAKIDGVDQVSSVTANDFNMPVTYVVTSEDASTTKNWEITITPLPSNENKILAFTIPGNQQLVDYDKNKYQTVLIGTQLWMSENLQTSTYNDGITIPNVEIDSDWEELTTGAYSWYQNNAAEYCATYGALYNWYAVATNNLCPEGWKVPSDEEWNILSDHLGGNAVAGGKMKSTGTDYWEAPNTDATNESGFSGLPGGNRTVNGEFGYMGTNGDWWTSSEKDEFMAYPRDLQHNSAALNLAFNGSPKDFGFSIRCIQAPMNYEIVINVTYDTDVTNLTPNIIISEAATISPASGEAQDFTLPVEYTVTAEDGSTSVWTVSVERVLNTATDITAFELAEQTKPAEIDIENHTISIEVANGTDLTSLAPTMTISAFATISPASGETQDFSIPKVYTVTAEDGVTSQTWVVTVTEEFVLGTESLVNKLEVFPNPASNKLIVRLPYNPSQPTRIYITDIRGGIMAITGEILSKNVEIDITSFKSGVYIILIESDGESISQRFIKK